MSDYKKMMRVQVEALVNRTKCPICADGCKSITEHIDMAHSMIAREWLEQDAKIVELQSQVATMREALEHLADTTDSQKIEMDRRDRIIKHQQAQITTMREALWSIRDDKKGDWEEQYDFSDRLQRKATKALASIETKEDEE